MSKERGKLDAIPEGVDEKMLKLIAWGWDDEVRWKAEMEKRARKTRKQNKRR